MDQEGEGPVLAQEPALHYALHRPQGGPGCSARLPTTLEAVRGDDGIAPWGTAATHHARAAGLSFVQGRLTCTRLVGLVMFSFIPSGVLLDPFCVPDMWPSLFSFRVLHGFYIADAVALLWFY